MSDGDRSGFVGAAVVTGGASGIGAATVARLRDMGVRVGIIDLNEPTDPRLDGVPVAKADVTDEAKIAAGLSQLADLLGPIGHLVCGAGIGPTRTPSTELPIESWRRMLAIHLDGTFFACRAFKRLRPSPGASVVTIGSVVARAGMPQRADYVAAKGAIDALSRCLAVEWADADVRVNCVHPGYVMTPMVREAYQEGTITVDPADYAAQGRLGQPSEIASVITFLLSLDASFMTGENIVADGGFLITKFR